jgi:ADP-ribose pyrophosphatase YjhB (NUDIX family)
MSQRAMMQRLAQVFRRSPWIILAARRGWQLTRPKFSMGVVGVIFNDAGHVLMVEHVFHPYVPWGLPGGWVERRESPELCLRRELREELALDADVGPVVAASARTGIHIDLAYLCYARNGVGALSFELLGYDWFDPDQLPFTHDFHREAISRARQTLTLETRV